MLGKILLGVVKALINTIGAKNTAKLATSKPVREIGKQIIKHEVKKILK